MESSDPQVSPGSLLLAPPESEDPNFRRTVVLICEHSDEGSFGLILNRPLKLHLDEVLEDDLPAQPLGLGGPVQQNTLHYLHRFGDRVSGSIEIADDVFWGGDFESIRRILGEEHEAGSDLRLFLGYAGWAAGQLGEEMALGGWLLAQVKPEYVFAPDPHLLWRAVLRGMGGKYAVLANFPDDPRLN